MAKCERVRHEFPDGDWMHQPTVFSGGTVVTVNFRDGTCDSSLTESRNLP